MTERNSTQATPTLRSATGTMPHKTVSVDGVELAYSDSGGNRPPLICLHAIGHGSGDFAGLSRKLSPQYRVIALDFPGHGNSEADHKPPSAIRFGEILSRFADALNLEPFFLLGNSIGGAASIRYTAEHPDRVRGLILCNPGGIDEGGGIAPVFFGAFIRFFAAGRRRAKWFPWAFRRYYSSVLVENAASEQREKIIRSAYEIAPLLEEAWKSFAAPEADIRCMLATISCPVFVAWAEADWTVQWNRSKAALDTLAHKTVQKFRGGHSVFLEDLDSFAPALREFLAGVVTRTGAHHEAHP